MQCMSAIFSVKYPHPLISLIYFADDWWVLPLAKMNFEVYSIEYNIICDLNIEDALT